MTERKQLIVINAPSSQCDDASVKIMLVACATLMTHVCNHWDRSCNIDLFLRSEMIANKIPQARDSIRILLVGEPNDSIGLLEDEKHEGGGLAAIVHTRPIFANRGSMFGSTTEPSVAALLFQTICGIIINKSGNIWWNDYVSGEFVAGVICAPVEGEPVNITVTIGAPEKPNTIRQPEEPTTTAQSPKPSTTTQPPEELSIAQSPETKRDDQSQDSSKNEDADLPILEVIPMSEPSATSAQQKVPMVEPAKVNVMLCNFVLPAWFDPASPADARFDFLGTVKEPFQISSVGCCLKFDPKLDTSARFMFGRRVPAWKREQHKLRINWGNEYHLAGQNAAE